MTLFQCIFGHIVKSMPAFKNLDLFILFNLFPGASVVYQNEAQQCRMYRRASFPDGELLRKSEDGHRYFEKFCLPEDAPAQCANRQFVRVDEYILKARIGIPSQNGFHRNFYIK